jgi:hypothetical protein
MTALDDALAEATVILGPHQLTANWREFDNGDLATNPDSISNLTPQSNGALTITHSLNDALPDPVTMSTGADASGNLEVGLIGREGLTLASSGQRAFDASSTATGATTMSLVSTFVNTVQRGDFVICAVLINDSTASLVQNAIDPKDQWTFQGVISDAPYSLYIYTMRNYYPGRAVLTLSSDKNVSYITMTTAFWASNPMGYPLSYRLSNIALTAEASSVTTHAVTSTLSNKGYQVGFWADASSLGAWTAGTGVTAWGSATAASMIMMTGTTALRDSGIGTLTATQGSATAVTVMAALSVEPYARPRLDARQYFSPFNRDSPVFGFDRDTASVLASIRVLTSAGSVDTQLFAGQMQGIGITGRSATMDAVSKTRIRLNRSVSLPVVGGYREGLTLDWLVSWLLSRGSQFIGPSPNRYTRYWAPLHGSMHEHWGTDNGYNASFSYTPPGPPGGPQGRKNPSYVDGPFLLGMFAQQSATRIDEILINPNAGLHKASLQEFPHITEAGGPFMMDMMSQANNKGRACFWIRGDAVQSAPTYANSAQDYIMRSSWAVLDRAGQFLGWVLFSIDSGARRPYIQMGSDSAGYTTVTYAASGLLPTDGAWHFYGVYWDFAGGSARVYGTSESGSNAWLTNGNNVITQLPPTDQQGRANVYTYQFQCRSHVPMSEMMYDAGQTYVSGFWDDQLSTVAPGKSVTMRALKQPLTAIAEATAVNAWDTLADVAKASLSWYRVNELDNMEFLPPFYFGETAQMTPVAVQDTKKNAGDLDVTIDPSKIRNGVTVQFLDSRIDTRPQPVLQYLSVIELPRGTSIITFPLDLPCVEIHGAPGPNTPYDIQNLTSAMITTPALPKSNHFISVNTSADGSGTVLSALQVSASFLAVDALSVTIQFVNYSAATVYLANNGDQIPFMQILGYGLRQSDGYTTIRDSSSAVVRGDRSLDTEIYWIQDRKTGTDIAGQMLSVLARPRPELALTVLGDPRRKPGQLLTILDAEGTGAAGTWRILSVAHNANGPQYTQDLDVVQVLPQAVWDGPDGWDYGVWS